MGFPEADLDQWLATMELDQQDQQDQQQQQQTTNTYSHIPEDNDNNDDDQDISLQDLLDLADDDDDNYNDQDISLQDLLDLAEPDADDNEEKMRALARLNSFEKEEYLQALREAPHLVQRESSWADFLWTDNYNPQAAALRLVRYWKARKLCFGAERWLRPLELTANGNGALWPADVELLQSGYFVVFVRPVARGVVGIMDYARLPPHLQAPMIRIRINFYIVHVFGRESRHGYTFINIERGTFLSAPKPLPSQAQAIYEAALPMKMQKCKILIVRACFEPEKEGLLDYATSQGREILRHSTKTAVTRIWGHSIRETRELINTAMGGTMEVGCLPISVGGTYDYNTMLGAWLQELQFAAVWHLPRVGREDSGSLPFLQLETMPPAPTTSTTHDVDNHNDNDQSMSSSPLLATSAYGDYPSSLHRRVVAQSSTTTTIMTPLYSIDYREYLKYRDEGT